jgi:hypothetical protein
MKRVQAPETARVRGIITGKENGLKLGARTSR